MRSHGTIALVTLLVLGTEAPAWGQAEEPTIPSPSSSEVGEAPIRSTAVEVRQRPRARLVVDYVAHSPAPATEGQSIAIEIKVKNEGTAASSGEESLHFECENAQSGGPPCPIGADQDPLPVLYPPPAPYNTGPHTHSVQLLTVPTWKPGTYTLRVWITAPRRRTRSEIYTATLQVKSKAPKIDPAIAAKMKAPLGVMPDLKATVKTFGGGTLYPVSVTVKNQGAGPSAATTFRMSCDEYIGAWVVGQCLSTIERPVPAIGAGQGANIEMPFAPPLHCDPDPDPPDVEVCKVKAVVDPANDVPESEEANNTQVYHVDPQ